MKRIISEITLALLVLSVSIPSFSIRMAKANGLVGDLNGDGKVNLEDLIIAAEAFGSYPEHPRWNPQVDVNGDDKIDMLDVYIIAKHFGETAPTAIAATIDICPRALNLRSRGRWITAYIELPEGYSPRDIDTSTIMLNGTVPAELRPITIRDCDCDGIPDLMVKFKRQKVIDLILRNCQFTGRFGVVTLTITGKLEARTFQGSDEIKIIIKCQ